MSQNIYIKKRDGSLELLDISKIQKMSDFVCVGTNCNSLELQSALHFSIRDGMETRFIHSQMTYEAINKISYNNPQWRLVAGRLKIMEDIKEKNIRLEETCKKYDLILPEYNLEKCSYSSFLEIMIILKLYDRKHFENFSNEELNNFWNDIVKIERNFDYFIESVITTEEKFLIGFETPQHLYFTISLIYTTEFFKRKKDKYNNKEFQNKLQEIYDAISTKKISLPSVILSELRKPNANLASCFIGMMPDKLDSEYQFIEDPENSFNKLKSIKKMGIMDVLKAFAMISKKGGGIGVTLDKIRAFKSWLMGVKGRATGVTPLMKVLNDLMLYVNQSGIKLGALTPALSLWHLDIISFLKTNQIGGEEREKAFDLFLQVVVNDEFMERAINNDDWYMFDPYELKKKFNIDLSDIFGKEFTDTYNMLINKAENGEIELFKKMRAKDIFKEAMRTMINKGIPYFFFKDNVNKVSNMRDAGTIYAGNLCQESFSIFDEDTTHTCNLLSLVHSYINTDEELRYYTHLGMEILDLTVDISTPPTRASKKHNDEIRAVGLGSMGLADWNAKNCISYETEAGQYKIAQRFEKLAYYALEKSLEMAKEFGAFKRFKDSQWAKGEIFGKPIEEILSKSRTELDWIKLKDDILRFGLRNGWLLAIAPNTTSSSAIGVSSSIIPVYSKFFIEETKVGNIPRLPLFIEEYPLNYKEFKHMDLKKLNSCVAEIQFWTDAGISYELIFDLNDTKNRSVNHIFEIYYDAWKKGIKALYYIRWIKPGNKVEETKTECIGCAG